MAFKRVKPHLREIVKRNLEGANFREIAKEFNCSHQAIAKWSKSPEWKKIESELKAKNKEIFMDNFEREILKKFDKFQSRIDELNIMFQDDCESSLKLAKAIKDEGLKAIEDDGEKPSSIGKISAIAASHQKAAYNSYKAALEGFEAVYGINEILKILDKEDLIE